MQRLFNILIIMASFIMFALPANAKDLKFIQITDLMYRQNESSQENFKALINNINKENKIDMIIFTGDNIADARKETLKEFLGIAKSLKYPYYVVLGDKDCLKANGLSKETYIKYLQKNSKQKFKSFNFVVKKGDVVFVFVDGAKEILPSQNGYYREKTLVWLNKTLKHYKNKNVIIVQHFPLFDKSETSPYNLYKADLYNEMLKQHKNVIMIVSGHYKENVEKEIDGITHFVTTPASDGISNIRKYTLIYDETTKKYEIYSHVEKINR